ncbi:hypothetical protein BC828DRAFT_175907 [Blastocladiella britannica]|nr:hypothetical protein BC828DRAFT_175907 [Blastocladiella britannica]
MFARKNGAAAATAAPAAADTNPDTQQQQRPPSSEGGRPRSRSVPLQDGPSNQRPVAAPLGEVAVPSSPARASPPLSHASLAPTSPAALTTSPGSPTGTSSSSSGSAHSSASVTPPAIALSAVPILGGRPRAPSRKSSPLNPNASSSTTLVAGSTPPSPLTLVMPGSSSPVLGADVLGGGGDGLSPGSASTGGIPSPNLSSHGTGDQPPSATSSDPLPTATMGRPRPRATSSKSHARPHMVPPMSPLLHPTLSVDSLSSAVAAAPGSSGATHLGGGVALSPRSMASSSSLTSSGGGGGGGGIAGSQPSSPRTSRTDITGHPMISAAMAADLSRSKANLRSFAASTDAMHQLAQLSTAAFSSSTGSAPVSSPGGGGAGSGSGSSPSSPRLSSPRMGPLSMSATGQVGAPRSPQLTPTMTRTGRSHTVSGMLPNVSELIASSGRPGLPTSGGSRISPRLGPRSASSSPAAPPMPASAFASASHFAPALALGSPILPLGAPGTPLLGGPGGSLHSSPNSSNTTPSTPASAVPSKLFVKSRRYSASQQQSSGGGSGGSGGGHANAGSGGSSSESPSPASTPRFMWPVSGPAVATSISGTWAATRQSSHLAAVVGPATSPTNDFGSGSEPGQSPGIILTASGAAHRRSRLGSFDMATWSDAESVAASGSVSHAAGNSTESMAARPSTSSSREGLSDDDDADDLLSDAASIESAPEARGLSLAMTSSSYPARGGGTCISPCPSPIPSPYYSGGFYSRFAAPTQQPTHLVGACAPPPNSAALAAAAHLTYLGGAPPALPGTGHSSLLSHALRQLPSSSTSPTTPAMPNPPSGKWGPEPLTPGTATPGGNNGGLNLHIPIMSPFMTAHGPGPLPEGWSKAHDPIGTLSTSAPELPLPRLVDAAMDADRRIERRGRARRRRERARTGTHDSPARAFLVDMPTAGVGAATGAAPILVPVTPGRGAPDQRHLRLREMEGNNSTDMGEDDDGLTSGAEQIEIMEVPRARRTRALTVAGGERRLGEAAMAAWQELNLPGDLASGAVGAGDPGMLFGPMTIGSVLEQFRSPSVASSDAATSGTVGGRGRGGGSRLSSRIPQPAAAEGSVPSTSARNVSKGIWPHLQPQLPRLRRLWASLELWRTTARLDAGTRWLYPRVPTATITTTRVAAMDSAFRRGRAPLALLGRRLRPRPPLRPVERANSPRARHSPSPISRACSP